MGDWEKLNEISLSGKEDFYSHLNVEDITDADYAQKSLQIFFLKKLGEYHGL